MENSFMKKIVLIFGFLLSPVFAVADVADPLGLSEYMYIHDPSVGCGPSMNCDAQAGTHRLTNLEADRYRQLGFILPNGDVAPQVTGFAHMPLPLPTASKHDGKSVTNNHPDVASANANPDAQATPVRRADQGTSLTTGHGRARLSHRPLPTTTQIANQTGTLPTGHPDSQGTIQVRPTNMPDNPTHEQIMHMKHDIKHIENTVGKALNLSLSAYAVAELPQATNGRSSFSMGVAANDGKTAEAVGYSTNFGQKLEYTIKVSVSHSGSENAGGAGFSYQW